MTDRFERLDELFHSALALDARARETFLHDPDLLSNVRRLLAAHERAGGFIQAPAITLGRATEEPSAGRRIGA